VVPSSARSDRPPASAIWLCSPMPLSVREKVHYKPVQWERRATHQRKVPFILQCIYEETVGRGGTLRMSIVGEPEAGVVVFEELPDPQYLVPIVGINTLTFGPSSSQRPDPPTFRLESVDE
jgi:hypothetical protein